MKQFKQLLAVTVLSLILVLSACSSLGGNLFQKPEMYNTLEMKHYQLDVTFKFLIPEGVPIPVQGDRETYIFRSYALSQDQYVGFLVFTAIDNSHLIGVVVDISQDPEEAGVGLAYFIRGEKEVQKFWVYNGKIPAPVSEEVFKKAVEARIAEHDGGI